MKLKSIKKVSSEVRYIIRVFDKENFVESFKIDYVEMSNDELTEILCNKYFKYENSKVRYIRTKIKNNNSFLVITVDK